jgi:membrane protein DedA with SNARE-associated domain
VPVVYGGIALAAFFSLHTLDDLLSQFATPPCWLPGLKSLGVPSPGQAMVITAALYASLTLRLDVWLVWAAAAAGAIIGDNIGYTIGYSGGYRVLRRDGSKVHIDETKLKVGRLMFDRHGGKLVFFGRFVSVLGTYAAFRLPGGHQPHALVQVLPVQRRGWAYSGPGSTQSASIMPATCSSASVAP